MKQRITYMMLAFVLLVSTFFPTIDAIQEVSAAEVGTTYYVSTINGSDNNDGTSQNEAFYSLQKINDMELQPGDHVLLEAGSTFVNGYLHLQGSGSADAPIVIDRYGDGADPKIETNGQGIWYQDYGKKLDNPDHKNKGYVSSSILLYDVEYIEINHLDISNEPQFDEPYSDRDKMNRTGVAAVAQNKGTINHIYLNGLNIHDVRGNVYDKHMNNGGIYFTVFQADDEEATGIPRYNDISIENNIVNDVSRWGIAVGYTAYWEPFAGIGEIPDDVVAKYGSSNVYIANNYVKDAGGDSITAMYLDRPIIEYNVSDGAANEINEDVYSETDFGRVAAGIWPWKSKDAVLQHNEAFDTHYNQDGQAWDADYGDGTLYQYNYSHNNGGGALMVCCGGEEVVNTVFRYNISQNDLEGVLNLPNNPMVEVYNNTFYMKEGVDFIRDGMTGGTANIENNIIYNAGETKEEDWSKNSNVNYSHNVYYNYENTPASDEDAITDDPKLVDPGSGPSAYSGVNPTTGEDVAYDLDAYAGYELEEDSPAIGKGKRISNNGGKDFFGNEVSGTPDIGAFQSSFISLDLHSDLYTIDADTISGVKAETTVTDFIENLDYHRDLTVEVFDTDGNKQEDSDDVQVDYLVKSSHGDAEKTYTIVGNSDNEILDTIFDLDEDKKTIYLPMVKGNETSVSEVVDGIEVDDFVTVALFDGDEEEVVDGIVKEGMTVRVTAQNGAENIYTLQEKNDYDYVLDYKHGVQGKVWFAQTKIADAYENLINASSQYNVWDGKEYAAVGLEGALGDEITANTHGLLVDSMIKSADEQSHSMAFRVPKSGTVTLSMRGDDPYLRMASAENPNENGEVYLSITLNGETVAGPYPLANDGSPLEVEDLNMEVDQGDFIRVEAINEGSPTSPSMYLSPLISYVEEEGEADKPDTSALEALLEEAEDYEAAIYTEESFALLMDTMDEAKAVIADPQSDEEVADALADLQAAIEGLEEVVIDTSALEALLAEGKDYQSDDYTEESYAELEDAMNAAQAVIDNPVSDEAVSEALKSLQKAIDGLEEVDTSPEKPDLEALQALVEEAKTYEAENYSEESYASLLAAIEAAEVVLADPQSDEEVADALVDLQKAIDDLEVVVIDTSALESLLSEAKDYASDDYTKESYAVLADAMAATQVVIENPESDEVVSEALKNLQKAIEGLEEVEPSPEEPNTEALEKLIKEAKSYDSEDYTGDSFASLLAAIEVAEAVLANPQSEEDVADALADLQAAMDGLEKVKPTPEKPDTDALAALVEEAKELQAADYTKDSFAALLVAIEAAEVVIANPSSERAVFEASKDLEDALAQLEEADEPSPQPEEVDKAQLKALVKEAADLKAANYTKATWDGFAATFAEAEAVLANEEASQEDVDSTLSALETALKSLEEVEKTPGIPEKPEAGDDNTDNESDQEKETGSSLPKTATNMYNWLIVGGIVLLLGLIVVVVSRKKT